MFKSELAEGRAMAKEDLDTLVLGKGDGCPGLSRFLSRFLSL
jgi:hypothetical protein